MQKVRSGILYNLDAWFMLYFSFVSYNVTINVLVESKESETKIELLLIKHWFFLVKSTLAES